MSVLVVLEQRDAKWNRLSFEALAAGKKLAEMSDSGVAAVVMGSAVENAVKEAASYPLEKIWVLDDPALGQYTAEGYTLALEQLIATAKPGTVVFPHTYQVRDYAAKLAARLGQPLISDVIDIKKNGETSFVRQFFQGKLNADILANEALQFVSIQAGAFRALDPIAGEQTPVEVFPVKLDQAAIRSKPEPPFQETQRSVDLGAADLIVSVGRGIREKENLQIAEELAEALGAELAASRPICDNGWLPMERQVGSSGQTVSPKVYFALGISGAIQHLVGMKGSKVIVAINKDESAPIFETADYGIVADLFDVVPAITEAVRKAKS